jgi:hypothetical protein
MCWILYLLHVVYVFYMFNMLYMLYISYILCLYYIHAAQASLCSAACAFADTYAAYVYRMRLPHTHVFQLLMRRLARQAHASHACPHTPPQRLMLCVGGAPATASKTHAGSAGAGSSDTAGKQGLQKGLRVQAAAGSAGAGSIDTAGKQPERQRRSAGKIRERVVEVVQGGGAGGADDAETETDAALSPDPEV